MKITRPTRLDFLIAFIAIIIFIFLSQTNLFESEPKAGGKKRFLSYRHNFKRGIITNKYIDEKDHMNRTIELMLNDSTEYYFILSRNKGDKQYNSISIKDSIISTEIENEFLIKRNTADTITIIHFN